MGKLETLEKQVEQLSADELAQFRDWFVAFDAAAWDARLARDVEAGALDLLAAEALAADDAGQTRPL